MSYPDDEFDEADDVGRTELAAREDPDESDWDDDDDAVTVPCPYCGKEMLEESEQCLHCRSYISYEDAPRRHPLWLVAGVVACVVVVLIWVMIHA